MINLLATSLTAITMLVHAIVGCCWHDRGTGDAACADGRSLSMIVAEPDSCESRHPAPHKPEPGAPHEPGCQEAVGSYVAASEVPAPDFTVNLLAVPIPLVTEVFGPGGVVAVNFSPPAPKPNRLHLALEVLRI